MHSAGHSNGHKIYLFQTIPAVCVSQQQFYSSFHLFIVPITLLHHLTGAQGSNLSTDNCLID